MTTDELRDAYLDFFVSKGCVRRPSDVLVPNDSTVLFTPAGMNQFKREFMGLGDPAFTRATTCQKCLRTGDIDNVGKTAFHETFFEMMGNFSFGDYFKREAIHWAWEFLIQVLKLDPERLTITVYLDDDEAYDIWRKEVKVPANRISRLGEDDNFWPAGAPTHGPNGVCGPCSEIFYHGNGPKEVEIWNLVFTQFNRIGPGELEPLPKKNIDTGMGLERAAACLQGVPTVFATDIFKPIVAAVAQQLGVDYVADGPNGTRIRRMADHARALTFCIHENVKPSNEKQGSVLRRLLRRAVIDAYQMGQREPFLHELPTVVAEVMGRPYPELKESVPRIRNVIREEEDQFLRTLDNGLKRLDDLFRKTKAAGSDTIGGKEVFDLHQTYGIWVDITESLATEHNLRIDRAGFDKSMEAHGEISRPMKGAAAVFATGPLDTLKSSYHHGSEFLGYTTTEADGKVIGIVEQGKLAESASASSDGAPLVVLVLDRTPFYGESGGQVGDVGEIKGEHFRFRVTDTKKDNDFTLHIGQVIEGTVTLEETVQARVDPERREAIRRAHSATHVLHHALHIHLGKHAQQAGSKVEPDRLRFDFANPEAVGRERLRAIEETVNERILRAEPITWTTMPISEAKSLGAMALFGEKYPEVVRVVQMGEFSRELCGGTHLDNVAQAGLFKLIGEESVAAGTRRITALTGKAALEYVRQEEDLLADVASTLKVPANLVGERVSALLEEIKTLKKQASQRRTETAPRVSADDLLAAASVLGDVKVIAQLVDGSSPDELRQLIDVLRRKAETGLAVLLLTVADGKVSLAAGLTPDLITRGLHAGLWLKDVAPVVGGGGGGRPDLAQAGGKNPEQVPAALEKALESIKAKLGS
ncbi:alanine--tRNA ligase [Singulisphaera acidiphila]|uniref:Alanine--tRNA ligase n=1 Tax=Singulisphaera acidiphila (strain ATCC BAA-1392 / DSM 18658 / VKM B-2454 / MOB10) TaxID=886293 RepID=L0DIT7_SINAD|nr:alanine--tRNA ligase [Singulisphaera acidiphila]AGA29299.1 alanine--tRNA ligase [Singulisphaera acidiphila DSM 18658]